MSTSKKTSFARPFEQFAALATQYTGSAAAFSIATLVVLVWLTTGPYFEYSNTWQLVINTGTTIVTFLMVFVIQKSQNKDGKAIQMKLNELIAAHERASNRLISIEDLTEEELNVLHQYYMRLAERAKSERNIYLTHSIDDAEANHRRKVQSDLRNSDNRNNRNRPDQTGDRNKDRNQNRPEKNDRSESQTQRPEGERLSQNNQNRQGQKPPREAKPVPQTPSASEIREERGNRQPREPREQQQPREPREQQQPREPREQREPREFQAEQRGNRPPREQRPERGGQNQGNRTQREPNPDLEQVLNSSAQDQMAALEALVARQTEQLSGTEVVPETQNTAPVPTRHERSNYENRANRPPREPRENFEIPETPLSAVPDSEGDDFEVYTPDEPINYSYKPQGIPPQSPLTDSDENTEQANRPYNNNRNRNRGRGRSPRPEGGQ